MNGVVHHALAFNTLLSSQETDANTDPNQLQEASRTRAFISFSVSLFYLNPPVSVKPADLLEFRPPRLQGNPSNLL